MTKASRPVEHGSHGKQTPSRSCRTLHPLLTAKELLRCEAGGLPRPGSDDGSDNKGQEQRASGSEQVPGKERMRALIMRPGSHQDPGWCRRGQPTGGSLRYRLRRTRNAVPEWLALSAGPGKTRRPVVRGRGGDVVRLLDGNLTGAPPCYPTGAMDPGRQGSGQADTAELPLVPGERGPVMAERDCLQSRELMAAPRTAEADRHVVAREPAATARENGRSVDQARPVLLAVAGRRTPDVAAVRGGPAAAGDAVGPRGVATVPALVWASAPLGGGRRGVREIIGDRYS